MPFKHRHKKRHKHPNRERPKHSKKHLGWRFEEYPHNLKHKNRIKSKIKHDSRTTTHHKIPRSRGGVNEEGNRKEVVDWVHKAWHRIFLNWTPNEVIRAFRVNNRNFFIRNNDLLKQDWFSLFGDRSDKEIIEIIKREWS
ncbi:MAG: hypothetical protein PHE59_00190 [Patescibacteria group bacterium]|nr:hypothetical protein [Patescibacteria group bacterium]MDD5164590.1 hypothetical protein [Patescibacteria group bacterium]MDD5534345.1 hypothetical protein [Patescibacteria group bacterium]